jgi:putative ABC transport system substrate-binding protein
MVVLFVGWAGMNPRIVPKPTPRTHARVVDVNGHRPYGPDMDRRRFLLTTLAGGLAAPLAVEAQPAGKVWRIGVFAPGSASGRDQFRQLVEAFRDGLRGLGWVEGQHIVVETRWGEGRIDGFSRIVAELVALPVDVIVAWGPQAIRAAQQATGTIPIVMAIVHEPVAFGFVKSLAHPGRNITGQAFQDSELGTKRLDLLRDIVPRLRRVALLWDAGGGGESGLRAAEASARKLGLTTQVVEVRRPEDFEDAFASARKQGAQAVMQIASPFLATYRTRLIELAAAQRLPMTCETRLFVGEGCLMAYGPSFSDMSRRAATYVDRILKGAKPTDLPVEQPTKFELVINLKTAKALGLTIPPSLLLRADQVIE